MAGGFSFPPPPPPPPKPAAQHQQPEFDYSQQSGRGGRGRGTFEPRGRGGPGRGRGRGGGNSNHEPLGQRTNSGQGTESAHSGPGHEALFQRQHPSEGTHVPSRPPPGSYINPNFAGQRQGSNANASYQPAIYNNQNYGESARNLSADTRNQQASANDGPGRTQAGHKRKLDALRGSQQPREKKPGPQTVPSVPSFGAPILPAVQAPAPTKSANNQPPAQASSRPQAASRTLGLTPKDGAEPDYSSESGEDDDDADEEAQFAELGTKLTFEHNGEVMTLNNEADLAAWKEERKKQFPTLQRVSQKEQELLEVGEERKRLLAAVSRLHQAPRNTHTQVKSRSLREPLKPQEAQPHRSHPVADTTVTTEQKPAGTGAGIQEVEMSEAPAVLHKEADAEDDSADTPKIRDNEADSATMISHESSVSQQNQEKPKVLPGIAMDETDDEEDIADDVETKPSHEGEAEPPSDSDSEDDGPPEQTSSRPPPPAASDAQKPVCNFFAASGHCRNGDVCRFRHELSSKAPSARPAQPQPDKPAYDRFAPKLDPKSNERKSIFERLVEQEKQGDDRLALQVIKALGQAGLFTQSETS